MFRVQGSAGVIGYRGLLYMSKHASEVQHVLKIVEEHSHGARNDSIWRLRH